MSKPDDFDHAPEAEQFAGLPRGHHKESEKRPG